MTGVMMRKWKGGAGIWLVGVQLLVGVGCSDRVPDAPDVTGPEWAVVGETLQFTVSALDPADDDICYRLHWSGGDVSGWSEYVRSGTEVAFQHSWRGPGNMQVRAQASDVRGLQSDWSEPHPLHVLPAPGYPDTELSPIYVSSGIAGEMILLPNRSLLYAVARDDAVVAVSTVTDTVVAVIEVTEADRYQLCASPDEEYVYVMSRYRIAVVSTARQRVVHSIEFRRQVTDFGMQPDGSRLYAVDEDGNILVVDPMTGSVLESAFLPNELGSPVAMAVHPDGSRIYVAASHSSAVAVISTATLEVLKLIWTGFEPKTLGLAPDGSRLYVGSGYPLPPTLTVIRTGADVVEKVVPVDRGEFEGIQVFPSGEYVFAESDGAMLVMSVPDLTVLDRLEVGGPAAFEPDGSRFYADSWSAGEIAVFGYRE